MQRILIRVFLLAVVPLAMAIGGAQYYLSTLRYVTTQNAYVKTTMVAISAEVTGRIDQLLTRQNRQVQLAICCSSSTRNRSVLNSAKPRRNSRGYGMKSKRCARTTGSHA